MNPSGSFFTLLTQGGLISVSILIILLGMSVLSWTIILRKWHTLRRSLTKANQYLRNVDLRAGLDDITYRSELNPDTFTAALFHSANTEFSRVLDRYRSLADSRGGDEALSQIERKIEASIANQSGLFEKDLNVLATISASAPFIGLFGTVTGIIDAFYSIGYQGAASIAVVAPGISAALVATAFGLFAAIPALIGYNVFRNKVRYINNEMRQFSLELVNLFAEELFALKAGSSSISLKLDRDN